VAGVGSAAPHACARAQFHLALENTRCDDYVTEKLYTALTRGQVPIVLGAPNVADHAPGHDSYIDATAFPSARALAEYLLYLDRNDTAYDEYHAWRSRPFTSYGRILAREVGQLLPIANGTGVGGDQFKKWFPCLMCDALQAAEDRVAVTEPHERPGCTFGSVPTFDATCHPKHNAWLDTWRAAAAAEAGAVGGGSGSPQAQEEVAFGSDWLSAAVAAAKRSVPTVPIPSIATGAR